MGFQGVLERGALIGTQRKARGDICSSIHRCVLLPAEVPREQMLPIGVLSRDVHFGAFPLGLACAAQLSSSVLLRT